MTINARIRDGDLIFLKTLGYGAFSRVELAEHKETKVQYAVKVVSKKQLERDPKLVASAKRERDVLISCHHNNIIRLIGAYQTPEDLCYILEFCDGGELLDYIKMVGRMEIGIARFITAEIVLGLEYLHTVAKVVHRDIKPENILLDATNHVKIADFGTACKIEEEEAAQQQSTAGGELGTTPQSDSGSASGSPLRARSTTFCGTTHYMSPEMLESNHSSYAVDLWGLGCVLFYMLCGRRPFDDTTEYTLIKKVLETDVTALFPEEARDMDPAAKDLICGLLHRDPSKRLGTEAMGGYWTLKRHAFFSGVNFDALPESQLHYVWNPKAPIWVKDSEVSSCRKCGESFTFFVRKHHCRRCGHIFCDKCSNQRHAIPQYNFLEPVRVCCSCFNRLKGTSDSGTTPTTTPRQTSLGGSFGHLRLLGKR
eukprot:PhM_4_TR2813/c0_g1_i1/m.86154/K06276/PDPK1; 3-phosphoinositide dependent protein kinase-1